MSLYSSLVLVAPDVVIVCGRVEDFHPFRLVFGETRLEHEAGQVGIGFAFALRKWWPVGWKKKQTLQALHTAQARRLINLSFVHKCRETALTATYGNASQLASSCLRQMFDGCY